MFATLWWQWDGVGRVGWRRVGVGVPYLPSFSPLLSRVSSSSQQVQTVKSYLPRGPVFVPCLMMSPAANQHVAQHEEVRVRARMSVLVCERGGEGEVMVGEKSQLGEKKIKKINRSVIYCLLLQAFFCKSRITSKP